MNTVLITEIKCVMLFLSFLISVMDTLGQFLTRQGGLIRFNADDWEPHQRAPLNWCC